MKNELGKSIGYYLLNIGSRVFILNDPITFNDMLKAGRGPDPFKKHFSIIEKNE